jgi:hypothetical protein
MGLIRNEYCFHKCMNPSKPGFTWKTFFSTLGTVCLCKIAYAALVPSSTATIDSVALAASQDINRKAPMVIDSETRLDSTMVANRVFTYKFTLINHAGKGVPQAEIDTIETTDKKRIINLDCSTPSMRNILDRGLDLSYLYYGNDGVLISTIAVRKSDCTS